MNVTRDNFYDLLPVVKQAIDEANFISIDTEFSGLTNGSCNTALFDSPEVRYHKLCTNTADFLLMQFGLATFCWDEDAQKYRVKTFNFYIFPSHSPTIGTPDRIFTCQSSSIEFLLQHGFDFNMVFKQGIPFLRESEEANLKSQLEKKQARRESFQSPARGLRNPQRNSGVPDSPDQKTIEFTENVCTLVQNFLSDAQQSELMLDPCNSYLRKVLYETIPQRFPNQITLESRWDEKTRQRHMVVIRGADEGMKKERQKKMKAQEEKSLQKAIGFSKVIKMLTESKKLIIGHNMLLDLMYTIQHFVSELPPTLDEFKALCQCVFPQVLDTKLMSSLLPFKEVICNTALSDLYARLKSSPFSPLPIEVAENCDVDEDNAKLHEAGYDAYITGCSFASMLQFLTSLQKKSKAKLQPSLSLITPYINKIFLMRTFDLPYLNIGGPDLNPNRDHVFHVTFPPAWKANDLRQLFNPFGTIIISWINDTNCFVGLQDKTQVEKVKQRLQRSDRAEPQSYRLMTYHEYHTTPHHSIPTRTSWVRTQAPETPPASSLSSSTALTNDELVSRKRPPGDQAQAHVAASADDQPLVKKHRSQGESPDDASPPSPRATNQQGAVFEVPSQW